MDKSMQQEIESDQVIQILNRQIPVGSLSEVEPTTNKH